MKAALTFKLAHDDLSRYNAVQNLLYTGVILAGVVIVLSGLSIWKPVQLQELTALFGGYDAARYVHFFAMAAIVGFIVVHAGWIDQAISATLAKGLRTADIKSEGTKVVSTTEMGSAILAELERLAA